MKKTTLPNDDDTAPSVFDETFNVQDVAEILKVIKEDPTRLVERTQTSEDGLGRESKKISLETAMLDSLNKHAAFAFITQEIEEE